MLANDNGLSYLVPRSKGHSVFRVQRQSRIERSHDLFGVATIVLECATPISRVEYKYYYYPDILPQTGELGLHPNPLSRTQISLTTCTLSASPGPKWWSSNPHH